MNATAPTAHSPLRNPGPSGGYRFLHFLDRILPEGLYRPARAFGTWFALLTMARERRCSREYLRVVLGREPSLREVFRHFFEFEEMLMLKLRVSGGTPQRGVMADSDGDFRRYLESRDPALLGTFHFAHSDLAGFLLGGQERRRVALIRLRVGNSYDTDSLGSRYADWVSFIWVNEGESPLLGIKEAIAGGASVALKCDRLDFSARTEAFRFLGAQRVFPFTIYHLGLIFGLPVLLTVGVPGQPGETIVHSTPAWVPDPAVGREANLARARAHFQGFLDRIEGLLRQNPYWWFNFTPLNPEVAAA